MPKLKVDLIVDDKGSIVVQKFGKDAERSMHAAATSAGNTARQFDYLSGIVKKLVATFALYKLADFAKDSALLSARHQTLGVVLEAVGKNVNRNIGELEHYTQALRDTGISAIESRQSLIRMMQANLDVSKSTQLARVAQDAAVIGQVNSSEALSRMIYGIQSAQVEVLRTIGINVNFENSYAKVAKQLGKTSNELSENEKAQIRMNAVLDAGKNISGVYEKAMDTAGKKLGSLTRYHEDFKVAFGKAFEPAMIALVDSATAALKRMTEIVSEPEFQRNLRDMAEGFGKVAVAVAELSKYAGLKSIGRTFAEGSELAAQGKLDFEAFKAAGFLDRQKMVEAAKYPRTKPTTYLSISPIQSENKSDGVPPPVPPPSFSKSQLAEFANSAKGVNGLWELKAKERYEVQSRYLGQYIYDERSAFEKSSEDLVDLWQAQAKERYEVQSRAIDSMLEKESGFSKDMETAFTGWASGFSSTLAGLLFDSKTTFDDIAKSFGQMFATMVIQKRIMEPLLGMFFGGGSSVAPSANGNVFSGGNLIPFARGGIVNRPTLFPMANGAGLMGEAGPEAVMPLRRGPGGRLGVEASGGGGSAKVIVEIRNSSKAEVIESPSADGGTDIRVVIDDIMAGNVMSGRGKFNKAMRSTYGVSRTMAGR